MNGIITLRAGRHISIPVSLRFLVVAPLLLLATLGSMYFALNLGTMQTSMADALAAIFLPRDQLSESANTVALFRLPRIVVAVLAGAMMAASGYLLQVVSRNGLADPGILGLSDGATVAVMLTGFAFATVPVSALSLVSLGGALATAVVVLGLGHRMLNSGGIILIGISVNILLGSVIEIILVSSSAMQFSQLLTWSRGTLAAVDGTDMQLVAGWAAGLIPLALLSSRMLQPMLVGDEAARALGVRARLVFVFYVLLAAAFAAPVIAACGPIAFVGLMSSYIARGLIGERPTEVLITGMLSGGLILLWADTLGRTLFSPIIVSAGVMISVVGVLVFILAARIGNAMQSR